MNGTLGNWTNSLCETSKQIVDNNIELDVIQIFECIFGLIAIFPNTMAIYVLWQARVFHSNLRILLGNLSLDLALYPAMLALKSFRRLITPVCGLSMKMKSCILQEWAFSIPLHNSLISLFVLCVERLCATMRYRTYDFAKSPPYLALFLLSCGWAATLFAQFVNFNAIPDHLWVPICETPLYGSRKQVTSTMIAYVVLEASAFAMTTFVYVYNRFILSRMVINRTKFDLSSRFQVDQNVKLSSALFPSDLFHVISYLPNYTFLIFTVMDVSLASSTKVWFLHSTYLYRIIYACLHPILLITRNPNMKQCAAKTRFGRVFKALFTRCNKHYPAHSTTHSSVRRTKTAADTHFSQLEEIWTIAHANREKTFGKK